MVQIKNKKKKIVLLLLILLSLILYFFVPTINKGINDSISVLTSLKLENVIEYIRSFGIYAVLVSFLLMVLQSIVSPIPAFLITLANAAIFGWVFGAILSWTSAMVGALLCFYISRVLGRDVVEKLVGKKALDSTDQFFEKYGKHTILVCRLLPFVSFDLVSYAAGLTSMSLVEFLIATGIGQLPATIVYSYLGRLTGNAKTIMFALLLLFSLSIIVYICKSIYNEKNRKVKKVENDN